MQLKFKASKLIEALDYISVVEPRALTAQQHSAAFLFHCYVQDGKPRCHVYSRGPDQVARAGFELDELEGEGHFTMPSNHVALLREVPEDTVTLESCTENKTDGEAFMVKLSTTSGTKYDHSTYDPRVIAPCDKDFLAAKENGFVEYKPFNILREALSMARPFLPGADKKGEVSEHFNTIQIFDQSNPDWAKGDGNLFCSDASRAFYFEFAEFKSKGFVIHLKHVGKLVDFLGKCQGVHIYHGSNLSFAVNTVKTTVKDAEGKDTTVEVDGDQIFAWNHDTKTHSRYAYYGKARDKLVIMAPKSLLLKALKQTQILIDQKQDRVKLYYTHANKLAGGDHTLHFGTSESAGKVESLILTTTDKKDDVSQLQEDFDCYVNLDNFRSIIQDAIGQTVELRISPIPKDDARPKGGAMLRTIDRVPFDEKGKIINIADKESSGTPRFTCEVTRFMPSTV